MLYATRWITNFCAPVFMLLAGVSAYLVGRRCTTRHELSRFLLTRGLWLAVLEVTVITALWSFNFRYEHRAHPAGHLGDWAVDGRAGRPRVFAGPRCRHDRRRDLCLTQSARWRADAGVACAEDGVGDSARAELPSRSATCTIR